MSPVPAVRVIRTSARSVVSWPVMNGSVGPVELVVENAEMEAKETKRETADFTKVYQVADGDTVSAIAGRVYGNPALWRAIAVYNDVDHPRRLSVGLRLLVPRLPFRDPESGEVYE